MAITKGKGGSFETKDNPFFNTHRRAKVAPDFDEVSGIGAALDLLVKAGCAVMFGRTRDGGAVVFTVLDGEKRHRTYCSNAEELQEAFDAIREMYADD